MVLQNLSSRKSKYRPTFQVPEPRSHPIISPTFGKNGSTYLHSLESPLRKPSEACAYLTNPKHGFFIRIRKSHVVLTQNISHNNNNHKEREKQEQHFRGPKKKGLIRVDPPFLCSGCSTRRSSSCHFFRSDLLLIMAQRYFFLRVNFSARSLRVFRSFNLCILTHEGIHNLVC